MPLFNNSTPTPSFEMRKKINTQKQIDAMNYKPIGVIGESGFGSYGYEGDERYYVLIASPFGDEYATRAKLSFNEAKGLFDAFEFYRRNDMPNPSKVTAVIRAGRKLKLDNADRWMFHFGKALGWSRLSKR